MMQPPPLAGHARTRRPGAWIRAIVVVCGVLLRPCGAGAHEESAPATATDAPQGHTSNIPRDPLFFLKGSNSDWSLDDGKLGCLLLSPASKGGSRVALGRHMSYGRGLFLVGLSIAVPRDKPDEPVALAAGGQDLARNGHMIARDLFFIPLSGADVDAVLHELWYVGTLWVTLRKTAMSEGGLAARAGVEAYGKTCSVKDTEP